MRKPEYIIVGNKKYKINTDFRVALECEKIARDTSIDELERALAIIYKLFGEEALRDKAHWEEFKDKAVKYLKCGKENKSNDDDYMMDYDQDESYINASFMSDYGISLENTSMHWWTFFDLLCGLTENCVLNRVIYVRNFDLSGLKGKERAEWIKKKEQFALKREKTKEEKELDKYWENALKER